MSHLRPRKTHASYIPALGVTLALAAGCASQEQTAPAPNLPQASSATFYGARLPLPPPYETRVLHLQLGADLQRCDVKEPHFFFDKSTVRPQAVPQMEHLAACLTTPPMSNVNLLLVGRADPRGTSQYNQKLGERRAEYVRNMLIRYGVPSQRIRVASRGEADAIGNTPAASYGYDRRVDIVQLSAIHPWARPMP